MKNMAIVNAGHVDNIIVVDETDAKTVEHFAALGGIILPDDSTVGIGWGYDGVAFSAPPSPTQSITVVSPRQIRLALNARGLRSAVESAVAASSQDVRDAWEFSLEIRRDDPLVVGVAKQLGLTAADVDDLFSFASQL